MINRILKHIRIFFIKQEINRLETSMMIFEIPYDIAIDRLNKLEFKLKTTGKMKLPNHLSFLLTKEDFETTDYFEPCRCALAKSVIRCGYKLGGPNGENIRGQDAGINGELFRIVEWEGILDAYDNPPSEGLMVNLVKI
jgi:hypothetical protein